MKKISKITLIVAATLSAFFALAACTEKKLELSKSELADKIKGRLGRTNNRLHLRRANRI